MRTIRIRALLSRIGTELSYRGEATPARTFQRRLAAVLVLALAGGGLSAYLLSTGPHMMVQQHLRAYSASMPTPPEGTVPLAQPSLAAPSAAQAAALSNPLQPTSVWLARGATYYTYYCAFCHSGSGDGNGPVGESYLPKPADLRSAKIQAYRDGDLLRAMLTGTGHSPVLEYTVLPEHRWPLVLHLRTLRSAPGNEAGRQTGDRSP
jgi:hypothetical protein